MCGHSYQVGATPSFIELPRNHCDRMKAYKDADAPLSLCPPELDPKWRFFWRIGDRPEVRLPVVQTLCVHMCVCMCVHVLCACACMRVHVCVWGGGGCVFA